MYGISGEKPQKIVTAHSAHWVEKRILKSTIPNDRKKADRKITFIKNQSVSRTTHATLSPRVIGVIKKRPTISTLDIHKSVHLFSTIQFPRKRPRVNSGETNVIS